MGLFRKKDDTTDTGIEGCGLFLFDDVPAALKAEKILGTAGYDIHLVAPPPHLRAGCDLAIALPAFERPGAERELADRGGGFKEWADTLEGSMALVDLVTTEDFGEWLMVRAGNMKITVEKSTGTIVNTSGGGCPDIPYLNIELVGRTLAEAPEPRGLGFTLCAIMLDRAFTEAKALVGTASRSTEEVTA